MVSTQVSFGKWLPRALSRSPTPCWELFMLRETSIMGTQNFSVNLSYQSIPPGSHVLVEPTPGKKAAGLQVVGKADIQSR